MTRKLSGSTNDASRIIVLNENNWEVEKIRDFSTGNFELTNLQAGNKTIVGRRNTDGEIVGYGGVDTIYSDFYSTDINYSALFDGSSDYLSKTWGVAAGSSTKCAFAIAVKLNDATSQSYFIECRNDAGSAFAIDRYTNGKIRWKVYDSVAGSNNLYFITTQVFRDVGGWYFFEFHYDSTPAAPGSDDCYMLVNGIKVTDFDTETYPSQNDESFFCKNEFKANIGANHAQNTFAPAYYAKVIGLDGYAGTSFGEFKSGVWVYNPGSLTYGTNGFHLDFSNAADLGEDSSGNGNDFTENGSPKQVTDTPTNNFATLNPLEENNGGYALSEGNLKMVTSNGASYDMNRLTLPFDINDGVGRYLEVYITAQSAAMIQGIVKDSSVTDLDGAYPGSNADSYGYHSSGDIYNSGGSIDATPDAYTTGDIIQIACKDGKVWFGLDGSWIGDPAAGTGESASGLEGLWSFAFSQFATPDAIQINAGNPQFAITSGNADENGYGDFEYAPPAGFLALCTANMEDPTIEDSSEACYVNARAGTGAEATISDVNFNASAGAMVVIKNRDQADEWKALDTVRGATKEINFDSANAESADADGLTVFSSSGYTLGSGAGGYNDDTENFLDWALREGADYGLDIVKYTGTGAAHAENHSLGQAPTMMWVKARETSGKEWRVYHSLCNDNPEQYLVYLSLDNAFTAFSNVWNDTAPTASQFTVGTDTGVNNNEDDFVAYLFADIPGYCKAFAYAGNGNVDGPYIPLGFRPALWFVKAVNVTAGWPLYNAKTHTYNTIDNALRIEGTGAMSTSDNYDMDACAEGIKIRTGYTAVNTDSQLYVGFAWAEQPGKWANAR